MAKAKAKKETRQDAHTSGFMVRLPARYKPALNALKKKTERPIAVEVRRAVDAALLAAGIEIPTNPSDSEQSGK